MVKEIFGLILRDEGIALLKSEIVVYLAPSFFTSLIAFKISKVNGWIRGLGMWTYSERWSNCKLEKKTLINPQFCIQTPIQNREPCIVGDKIHFKL